MKTFATALILAFAAASSASPSSKRVETTKVTICKQKACGGDASQRTILTLEVTPLPAEVDAPGCLNVPAGFDDQIIAVRMSNPNAICNLRELACTPEGNEGFGMFLTVPAIDDLESYNPQHGKKTSSIHCFSKQ